MLRYGRPEHLILVVYADPILCGHATEARNICETAIERGFQSAHIVTYPFEAINNSGVALKPVDAVVPYSAGIEVHRPPPLGDYKILDGRICYAMTGKVVELLSQLEGTTLVMGLSLVPHGNIVLSALQSFRYGSQNVKAVSIAKAIGSDVTNVVRNAIAQGSYGHAQLILENYLSHHVTLAVSHFTKKQIVLAVQALDNAFSSTYSDMIDKRVHVSYPAVFADSYTRIERDPVGLSRHLSNRGLVKDGYLLFLSRIARPKGVDDLIHAYRASKVYANKTLVIYGRGPDLARVQQLAGGNPKIRFFTDLNDEEKGYLMHGAWSFVLPSKPTEDFIETFGIVIVEKSLAGGDGPIICTNVGGIPEASGGNCLYHEAGSHNSLTAAIDAVADMSFDDKKRINRRARQHALRFDRQSVFDNLLQLVIEGENSTFSNKSAAS